MKTIIILFLSFFLTKTCQQKKENVQAEKTNPEQFNTTVSASNQQENNELKPIVEDKSIAETTTKSQKGTVVAYEASSRGYFQKIIFENSKITIHKDRNMQTKPEIIVLPDSDVSDITKLIQAIKLDNIANLKSPTNARAYDGAAHANITINYKGSEYIGNGFDAGKPPAELEKIVGKLLSYSSKK